MNADATLYQQIRQLGDDVRAQLGATDVRALKRLKLATRAAEIVGRTLLHAGVGPASWCVGTAALAFHFAVESQLNHSIMHGAFVGLPGAEAFAPERYETLAVPFQSKTWGEAHRIHHAHPSLLDKDPDTVHPLTRVHRDQRWRPWHIANLFVGVLFVFECWAVDYDRYLKRHGRRAWRDQGELRKLVKFLGYNYLLLPALAGPNGPRVLAGNMLANIVRNLIFVGLQTASSVGRGVSTRHDRDDAPKSKEQWARFQVETSKNFVIESGFWRVLCGGLDRHIEHHLFPRLPPNRLHQISEQVRRLCERAGVTYEEHSSVWASLADSVAHLWAMSVPRRSKPGQRRAGD